MAYYDVEVIISASQASGQAGSWFPLIYVEGEEVTYKEYADITEVVADYANTTNAYKVANLIFMQDNKPDKIAIMAGSMEDVVANLTTYISKDWRQLIVCGDYSADVSTYIEATEKMYFTHFATLQALTAAKINSYDRTVAIVYTGTDVDCPEAALVGATAGLVAGSFTYHCTVVKGVTAEPNSTDLDAIHSAGGFAYVEKNGRIATSNGITGSGEWIDVIDSYDYLIQNIRYDVQEVFLINPKVAYTNEGISKIDNAVYSRLKTAFNNGMIATDDNGNGLYSTSFKPRSETTAADRASRNYPYTNFDFELAGAIHKAKIKGTVTA